MKPRIVIETGSARKRLRRKLGYALWWLLLLAGVYGLGNWHAHDFRPYWLDGEQAALEPLTLCERELRQVRSARRRLAEEAAYLTQSVAVEREACAGVTTSLVEQQEELSKLREQLAFYRGIVAPDEVSAGIQVHGLDVRLAERQVHEFRLTLTQAVRGGEVVRAKVKMSLEGLRADQRVSLPFSELLVGGDLGEVFEFRYYKELFGEFRLPRDLTPLRISVTLDPVRRGQKSITRTFAWTELLAGG